MRNYLFMCFIALLGFYSCTPGKLEDREDCFEENCKEIYLVNTSKNKQYKFVILYESQLIEADTSVSSIVYRVMWDAEEAKKKIQELKTKREKSFTKEFELLPGESVNIGKSLEVKDLVIPYYSYRDILKYKIDHKIVGYLEVNK